MNTLAVTPVPGLAPELPAPSSATDVVLDVRESTKRGVKDTLVAVYAYGLLAFGLLFPFVLAAWVAFFGPDAQ